MMPKKTETLLALDPPEELIFMGPFDHPIGKTIKISNPSKTACVTFKMKTTSPRLFFVRPNIGVLKPDKSISIEIYLQPIVQPELKQKRHKFMIQAAEIDSIEDFDLPEFWKNVKLDTVWDARIRCELINGKIEEADAVDRLENKMPMHEEEVQDASEPIDVDKLMKKVSALEEERFYLKQELKSLRKSVSDDQNVAPYSRSTMQISKGPSGFFYITATILTMSAAVLGAYIGARIQI